MARMPGTKWVGEQSPLRPMRRYDIVCIHTIVGFAPAHAAHFSVKADGTILQSRDTEFQSGANLDGNHRVIAIENEDHGPAFGKWDTGNGHAVPALTNAQVKSNGRILAWAHKEHGIPLKLSPNSLPTSRGLGYHRQGISGNFLSEGYKYPGKVPGGETWTTSPGKVCPGDDRIDQRVDVLAYAKELLKVAELTKQDVRDIVREELKNAGGVIMLDMDGKPSTPKRSTLEDGMRYILNGVHRIEDLLKKD